jgi:hypothetical protein
MAAKYNAVFPRAIELPRCAKFQTGSAFAAAIFAWKCRRSMRRHPTKCGMAAIAKCRAGTDVNSVESTAVVNRFIFAAARRCRASFPGGSWYR